MVDGKLDVKLSPLFDRVYEMRGGIQTFKMLIDGRWHTSHSGALFDVFTPIDGSLIARAQLATPQDVEHAVDAAHIHRKIREMPAIERIEIFKYAADLLHEHREEIAHTIQLEAGKTLKDAMGEVEATINRLKLTMEEARKIFGEYIPGDWSEDTAGKIALVIHEPIGVVAAISPFNYPLYITSAKVIPALLSGNSVVVKPSSITPLAATLLTRILEEVGIPEGSLNIVTGHGKAVGDALVTSEKVGMITFTGSTPVGRSISQLATMKRLHLELGGKGYAVVLKDADIDLAAKKCVAGALKFAGQRCDAVSAILAVEPIADALRNKILQEVDGWKFGDPRDEAVRVGPVINSQAAERIHSLVEDAVKKGAELLKGGKFSGCYHEPTVLDRVPLHARIVYEETFGPVVTLVRVRDEDEALAVAAKSRYGLDACVFTNDFYKMWKMAKGLQYGEVTINDLPAHGVGYFPFGGVKDSGVGREGVGYSIDEMTNLKTIVFNLEPAKLGKVRQIYRM